MKQEYTSTHIQTIKFKFSENKILQFWFKFYYNRVLQQKVTRRCRSDTLDDTRATPCPKMPTSEAVNAYRVS
jgi:hypothetical protein